MEKKAKTISVFKKHGMSDEEIDSYFTRLANLRVEIHPDTNKRAFLPKESYIKSNDGIPIYFQRWIPKNPKGLFLCQHGNSVHGDLFVPFADEVVPQGWAVISIDNRGHGRSGPTRGYIDKPQEMIYIYQNMIASWRKKYPNTPIIFIGESLGCIFNAMYCESKMGKEFPPDSIIFMVPPLYVGPLRKLMSAKSLISLLVIPVLRFLEILSFGHPLMKHRSFEAVPTYLKTFSEYDINDPLINDWIYLGNFRSLASLFIHFQDYIKNIDLPILILQGTGDSILDPVGAFDIFNLVKSKKKKIKYYKNANHSLFMDKNSQAIYQDIMKWAIEFSKTP